MPRRFSLPLLLLLLLPVLLLDGNACSPAEPRPNVLVISLCSVRPDHMSLYGYPRQTTTQFEKLAQDAVVFDHAVTQWPKTAPAFAALMSGQFPHTNGVMRTTPGQHLDESTATLAETLGRAGYDSAAFFSTPAVTERSGILRGFETIEETFRLPKRYLETTERATTWLLRQRGRPFFAWVHYNNAHYPYEGHGAPAGLYVDDEFYDAGHQVRVNRPEPLNLVVPQDNPNALQIRRPDLGGVHPWAVLRPRSTELDFYVARYDAGIYGADRMAGQVLDAVREAGLLDDTLVVLVGDHGEALGGHDYYFEHGRFPYDDSARVPLLIRPPGGTRPTRISDPVPSFSLAPTVLELVGLRTPDGMEAPSLAPMMAGAQGPEFVYTESGYQCDYTLAVRDARFKLIYVPNRLDRQLMQGSEYELYDLVADPGESRNLIETRTAVADRLRSQLREWSAPWIGQAFDCPGGEGLDVDSETLEDLRNLGYVGN